MRRAALAATAAAVAALVTASPAHADVDTDFANTLHTYGIYGQRDYNAWIAKIACKRLGNGTDADAYESAAFVGKQLARGSSTEQVWKFLGLSIDTYCPEQHPVLERAAGTTPSPATGPALAAEQPS